jgi:voltage-gated potassium channel
LNFLGVPESVVRPGKKTSFVERRIRRIVNARSVTVGLALTFVGLALLGGVIMRFVDHENFPSVGIGIWWGIQTVTTVGYGDVVPTTVVGRTVGGIVMVIGIAFISFVTAGVTSTLVQRAARADSDADREHREEIAQRIVGELVELEKRLDAIDSRLAG